MRSRSEPASPLMLYAKHVLVAWPGLFIALMLVGMLASLTPLAPVSSPEQTAPWFPASLIAGLLAGYYFNRRDRTELAALAFLPPLAMFLYSVWESRFVIAPPESWNRIWQDLFSGNCGSSDCLSVLLFTAPLYAGVAYSLAAWWQWRRGKREPAEVDPAGDTGEGAQATGAKAISRPLLYACHVLIAWTGLFLALAAAEALLAHTPLGRLLDPNPPLFPASVIAGLLAGYYCNRGGRASVARWVFVPPLVMFLWVSFPWIIGHPGFGGWANYWRIHFTANPVGRLGAMTQRLFVAPLYATAAYSLAAWWQVRRGIRRRARPGHGEVIA